ncbi:MAG: hypothetical protein RL154_1097 [Pseudomonadota bacterium]|jgi:tetratricopeptide (TPR) repeat protein
MYDIIDLEQKWQVYNFKRKKRYINTALFAILPIVLLVCIVLFVQKSNETKPEVTAAISVKSQEQPSLIAEPKEFNISSITTPYGSALKLSMPEVEFPNETKSPKEIVLSSEILILQKQFAQTKDYKNAIELAKAYFAIGNYEQSRHYAIEANSFDASKDEGWIVFAKSSVKLGAKTDAINALSKYNQTNGNSATKELEKELKNQ